MLGRPDLAQDERFKTNAGRVRNNAMLTPILVEALAAQDRDHWVEGCARAGVPCGPINTIPEALDDAQVRHRGMRIDIAHPLAGHGAAGRLADALSQRAARRTTARRRCSASTREEILRELGWDADVMHDSREIIGSHGVFPSPLWGGVRGGGPEIDARLLPHSATPLPNPPPQGGRERTEFAARLRIIRR